MLILGRESKKSICLGRVCICFAIGEGEYVLGLAMACLQKGVQPIYYVGGLVQAAELNQQD
jgi:hypothetical protein